VPKKVEETKKTEIKPATAPAKTTSPTVAPSKTATPTIAPKTPVTDSTKTTAATTGGKTAAIVKPNDPKAQTSTTKTTDAQTKPADPKTTVAPVKPTTNETKPVTPIVKPGVITPQTTKTATVHPKTVVPVIDPKKPPTGFPATTKDTKPTDPAKTGFPIGGTSNIPKLATQGTGFGENKLPFKGASTLPSKSDKPFSNDFKGFGVPKVEKGALAKSTTQTESQRLIEQKMKKTVPKDDGWNTVEDSRRNKNPTLPPEDSFYSDQRGGAAE